MPLANAAGKHIVTIEGINPAEGSLTPVQKAMVDESGTQCGFCTVGFVMSLTGYCLTERVRPRPPRPFDGLGNGNVEAAISSIDGNICRCTGYKSIERATESVCRSIETSAPYEGGVAEGRSGSLRFAIEKMVVPEYFNTIANRLSN